MGQGYYRLSGLSGLGLGLLLTRATIEVARTFSLKWTSV